jgi:hypothetical protein
MLLGEAALGEGESYSLIAGEQQVDIIDLGQRLLEKWERFFRDNGI